MNYELAKELKDAGYPQMSPWSVYLLSTMEGEEHSLVRLRGTISGYSAKEILDEVSVPTLSELISACGDGFIELKRVSGSLWTTHKEPNGRWGIVDFSGATPEEAVAMLWLALNKKV